MAKEKSAKANPALAATEAGLGDEQIEGWSAQPPPIVIPFDVEEEEKVDPLIGRVLSGLYRVTGRIGEGGMGTVYNALHVHLNKPFAVKVLAERIAKNQDAVERLRQEAQAASSIDHDNIVDVVSFDATPDGRVYLVMELLEGTSLGDLVDRGPMDLVRALPIHYQLCDAIGAAHDNGIVHRDLKPDNVFIVRKANADFVKVLDFGISKVKSNEAEQVRMTKTGQLMGTPLYMSPEQAKGEMSVDHRADIYSMGVMLYEMLAGRPPFEGGNYFQLLWKHGNELPIPLAEVCPSVPANVSDAVMRSLSKDPADRFQSTAQFRAALVGAAPSVTTSPERLVALPSPLATGSSPSPAPPSTKTPWAIAGLCLILAVGGVSAAMMTSSGEEDASEVEVVDPVLPTQPTQPTQPRVPGSEGVAVETLPETAVLPTAEETPQLVEVRFESEPSGARVVRTNTGEELGRTPFALDIVNGDTFEVTFRRPRHRSHRMDVVVEEGAVIRGRLRPTPVLMNDIPMGRSML
ncbi:MAG: serine/threonine protein kinase [Polyangiales bacterium]|jgi:serine/threonine protein kinase